MSQFAPWIIQLLLPIIGDKLPSDISRLTFISTGIKGTHALVLNLQVFSEKVNRHEVTYGNNGLISPESLLNLFTFFHVAMTLSHLTSSFPPSPMLENPGRQYAECLLSLWCSLRTKSCITREESRIKFPWVVVSTFPSFVNAVFSCPHDRNWKCKHKVIKWWLF